jgi:hypothetical protein
VQERGISLMIPRAPLSQRIASLRRPLLDEEPGARGIEHWARNPDCLRLGALMLVGISPETALQRIYQEPLRKGQSPFAFVIGNTFEQLLFTQNAARLVDLYCKAGRLPPSPRVVNLDTLEPQTDALALARRRMYTCQFIEPCIFT